ncbi:hypothetical protein [Deinococcus budaensis]|uniref:Suppressor of fused-like domain-containing protein n=1 Tax=Deinococcus budaensis TaxID=1665626 RepID=A0A7W8LPP4_9DEIO|nr:hypothetical protein [Deinococcus budaensis]MBB5233914.1 hypothetical protein [Deinococcus budaensis]
MNLGEAYLDHYERYLGSFASDFHARFEHEGVTVQLLDFAGAMQDTHVLASLGLTHYQDVLGEVVEVIVPVSELDDVVVNAVAASLTFLLNLRVTVPEVSYLRHLHRSVPEFAERYGKVAFAFTEPYPFPDSFAQLALSKSASVGKVRMGFFLSEAEVRMVEREGFDVLSTLFEEQQVDAIDLQRPSVV